jgi:thioesterase domain-containing protein/aryl carrier-like protein
MYGPTETTVWSTAHRTQPTSDTAHHVPIGRPIANTQIYVLDASLQPVPIGVTGEMYIGGAGVARSYWNRPELTRERFIPDPFSAVPDARMYKSGDLGRWLADGTLEYLGRNDFQVKIRGFRIELGEIEARLLECAGVREAVVIARAEAGGDKRLVAYVVPAVGMTVSAAQLRSQLSTVLAEYMVPGAFVALESLPLTPNGKLDRKALPAPDQSAVAHREYVAPAGELESTIAQIWQELLGLPQVGRHDHFFELGGHSLLALQMLSRLHQASGVDVPLRELFANPTLHAFSAAIPVSPARKPRNLDIVRDSGRRHPLFLIHEGSGESAYTHYLASSIHRDIPVYGLAASGLTVGADPLQSIQEMSTLYTQVIRTVQPHGPYSLAGWSAGGTIAYAMAHQLLETGTAVDFLGLIDTPSSYPRPAGMQEPGRNHPAPDDVTMLLREALDQAPVSIHKDMKRLAAAHDFDAMLTHLGLIPRNTSSDLLRRSLAVRYGIRVACYLYQPQPLPVSVTLFSAIAERRADISIGWQTVMPPERLRVVPISGTHVSLMNESNSVELGRLIWQIIMTPRQS